MIRYLAQRAFSSLIALFLFLTLIFFLSQLIIPTDFTTQFAMTLNRDARAKLQHELGIDQPLWQQYLNWVQRLLHGNLGTSFGGRPVTEIFRELLPYTLLVFFTGTAISFSLGKWLGQVVAWRGPGLVSGILTFSAVSLYTTFPPWLTFLVTYFFARRLIWFASPHR
ncbi:MAG: ABC transporter permease [Anaerolineae bacterium]|nr:ABC transporter permease [Anaerolineae bacterium]